MFLGSVTPAWRHAAKGPCCGVKHGNRKDPWSSNVRVVGKFSKIIIIVGDRDLRVVGDPDLRVVGDRPGPPGGRRQTRTSGW